MIRPTKSMDLDVCLLNCSASIIEYLSKDAGMKYDALVSRLISQHGEQARFQFPYALSLLFMLGSVDYYAEADSFRLRGSAG
jgi:ABC-three component (ABC-3C) system Middle Component 8